MRGRPQGTHWFKRFFCLQHSGFRSHELNILKAMGPMDGVSKRNVKSVNHLDCSDAIGRRRQNISFWGDFFCLWPYIGLFPSSFSIHNGRTIIGPIIITKKYRPWGLWEEEDAFHWVQYLFGGFGAVWINYIFPFLQFVFPLQIISV